jgi:hypothetical protein
MSLIRRSRDYAMSESLQGRNPRVGGVGVAVYGDLTAGRVARVMGWSAEQTAADALR